LTFKFIPGTLSSTTFPCIMPLAQKIPATHESPSEDSNQILKTIGHLSDLRPKLQYRQQLPRPLRLRVTSEDLAAWIGDRKSTWYYHMNIESLLCEIRFARWQFCAEVSPPSGRRTLLLTLDSRRDPGPIDPDMPEEMHQLMVQALVVGRALGCTS
jgi:hypothetical protein